MSIRVTVSLLSGRSAEVEARDEWLIDELQQSAQNLLSVRGRLRSSSGSVLDRHITVTEAGLQNGDMLMLHAEPLSMAATSDTFAAVRGDGALVSWGKTAGDQPVQTTLPVGPRPSRQQDELQDVRQVRATTFREKVEGGAFAALLMDGSVVTWGDRARGGCSKTAQKNLRDVRSLHANDFSFAAILSSGSVVTWGHPSYGGDSTGVADALVDVQTVHATARAFAALRADGSVVTWGSPDSGADSREVQHSLRSVRQIQATRHAFAAVLTTGSVVTWGNAAFGGDSTEVQVQLSHVNQVASTDFAFAALLAGGSVVTWGSPFFGGFSSGIQEELKAVREVHSNDFAFAACLENGSIVTWGTPSSGGNSSAIRDQLQNVQQISASSGAFAALLVDGSVVTWGNKMDGGDCSRVKDKLKHVQQLHGGPHAFAAVLGDGSVVTWGDPASGGDSSSVQNQLKPPSLPRRVRTAPSDGNGGRTKYLRSSLLGRSKTRSQFHRCRAPLAVQTSLARTQTRYLHASLKRVELNGQLQCFGSEAYSRRCRGTVVTRSSYHILCMSFAKSVRGQCHHREATKNTRVRSADIDPGLSDADNDSLHC